MIYKKTTKEKNNKTARTTATTAIDVEQLLIDKKSRKCLGAAPRQP